MPTRREFIKRTTEAGMVLAALSGGGPFCASATQPDRPRTVDQSTLQLLLAAAEAVTGVRPLRGHYVDYYRYRAMHSPSHLETYNRFRDAVSRVVRKSGYNEFVACDLSVRFRILDALRSDADNAGEFEIPVFQETLAVFEKTDAWLVLGYESWEGSARGLDSYQERITD
jgi:hypothetical protein